MTGTVSNRASGLIRNLRSSSERDSPMNTRYTSPMVRMRRNREPLAASVMKPLDSSLSIRAAGLAVDAQGSVSTRYPPGLPAPASRTA